MTKCLEVLQVERTFYASIEAHLDDRRYAEKNSLMAPGGAIDMAGYKFHSPNSILVHPADRRIEKPCQVALAKATM